MTGLTEDLEFLLLIFCIFLEFCTEVVGFCGFVVLPWDIYKLLT